MSQNNSTLIVLSLLAILVTSIYDNSLASFCGGILILCLGLLFCLSIRKKYRSGALRTLFVVTPVYVILGYFFSLSFDQERFFGVSDSMRYLQYYQGSTTYFKGIEYLYETYWGFTDNNGLYNSYVQFWAAIGNLHLGGATVFYMTLAQTLFGILCSIVLYNITTRINSDTAAKNAILFSCCSIFLFYSSVIVRDITVAFFFLLALDLFNKEFSFLRLVLLVCFGFIVWGIRLYSGLFYFIFPLTYLYLQITRNVSKQLTIIVLFVLGLLVMPIVATTSIGEQTQAEIEIREEFAQSRNENGLFNKLSHLPPGVKQVSLTLFSQIAPFPPFGLLQKAGDFSQAIMGGVSFVYEIFWFFIFFTVAYLCIINGSFKLLLREDVVILIIALLYIIVNTAHTDIRRMMPVYPIIYVAYLKLLQIVPKVEIKNAKSLLRLLYAALLIFALIYRG